MMMLLMFVMIPIEVILEGIITNVRFWHPLKALSAIIKVIDDDNDNYDDDDDNNDDNDVNNNNDDDDNL